MSNAPIDDIDPTELEYDLSQSEVEPAYHNTWWVANHQTKYTLRRLKDTDLWVCYTRHSDGDEPTFPIDSVGELQVEPVELDTTHMAKQVVQTARGGFTTAMTISWLSPRASKRTLKI